MGLEKLHNLEIEEHRKDKLVCFILGLLLGIIVALVITFFYIF